MKRQYIIVEHRQPEQVKRLNAQVQSMRDALAAVQTRYNALEMQYGNEVYINAQLVDLCRAAGIHFHKYLDHKERENA